MSETALVRSILQRLALEPGVLAMRNSVGSRGVRKFGLGEGSADIICCVMGRFVALECKSPKGVLSAGQNAWLKRLTKAGGGYFTVRSVKEAVDWVRFVRQACR